VVGSRVIKKRRVTRIRRKHGAAAVAATGPVNWSVATREAKDAIATRTEGRDLGGCAAAGWTTIDSIQRQTRGYLMLYNTAESRLYVQVGTSKFGRRTERDVQVKIIFPITPCEVFWMRMYQLDVKTIETYN